MTIDEFLDLHSEYREDKIPVWRAGEMPFTNEPFAWVYPSDVTVLPPLDSGSVGA